jgi:GrpB-like predicted nucleotidyltransferase (UPF0157 family)
VPESAEGARKSAEGARSGDASLRDAYARLKRELAAAYPKDRPAYTAGKTGFVTAV